jgi:hypothetical protein
MRAFLLAFLATCLLVAWADAARADDLGPIVDKAIKAHGGADRLAKYKATQVKTKGTLHLGGSIPFTQEVSLQMPDRVKSTMDLEAGGKKITVILVFDGKKGWINAAGQPTKDMDDKVIAEVKEDLYAGSLIRLMCLKDKAYELSPLGEVKIDGRPAVGIKVSSKGHRDVSLFFDKETGLLAKTERRAVDPMSGQEYTQEKLFSDYHDVNGIKTPKRAVVNKDGEKYLEAEQVEAKNLESLDDSVFAKP